MAIILVTWRHLLDWDKNAVPSARAPSVGVNLAFHRAIKRFKLCEQYVPRGLCDKLCPREFRSVKRHDGNPFARYGAFGEVAAHSKMLVELTGLFGNVAP